MIYHKPNAPFNLKASNELESRGFHLFAAELSCLKGVTTELTEILKKLWRFTLLCVKNSLEKVVLMASAGLWKIGTLW